MITALDSSVIWGVVRNDRGWERWVETLQRAASEGSLIISPVAFA